MVVQEVGRAEVSRVEMGRAEVSRVEVDRAEVGRVEVGRAEVGRVEVGGVEVGRAEVGREEVGRAEVGRVEVGRVEVGNAEVGNAEDGHGQGRDYRGRGGPSGRTVYRTENSKQIFPEMKFLHSCFCERFIYSHDRVCLFCCGKIGRPIIAHRNMTTWKLGRAVSFLGVHKSDFLCSVLLKDEKVRWNYMSITPIHGKP